MAADFSRKSRNWDELYAGDPPAWEIGGPQPALVDLAARGEFSGRFLDVGCGTGEHTILAAQSGAEAVGIDVSPRAISIAVTKARDRGVSATFAVADALNLQTVGGIFDAALDSGLFHVFGPEERPRYAASLASVIRRDGILFMTCMSDRQPGDWGPHRVTEQEIRETFGTGWVIESLTLCDREIRRPEVQVWQAKAWLTRIRRIEPTAMVVRAGSRARRPTGPFSTGQVANVMRSHATLIARTKLSPLFVSLVESAADDLAAGGVVADAFRGIDTKPGSGPALRLFAAFHQLVLLGRAPELALYFPTAGGTAPPTESWSAARDLLVRQLDEVRSLLREPVQTNETGRATALFGALLLLVDRYRLPVRLLEIGASAGLNLQVDRFHYRIGGESFGDPSSTVVFEEPWRGSPVSDLRDATRRLTVSARLGCDTHPVDLSDETARLRMLSFVWPDQPVRVQRMRAALELACRSPAPVDRAPAVKWLKSQLACATPRCLTVIWGSVIRVYMNDDERARLEEVVLAAGARATDAHPLASIELEASNVTAFAPEVVLRTWPGAHRELLARCHIHGPPVNWLTGQESEVLPTR